MPYYIRTQVSVFAVALFLIFSAETFCQNPDNIAMAASGSNISALRTDKKKADSKLLNTNEEKIRRVLALLEASPDDAILLNNLGAAYGADKNYGEAIRAFQSSINLNGGFAETHSNLSVIFEETKRIPEAVESARRALAADHANVERRIRLCELLVTSGGYKAAIKCYRNLEKISPLDAFSQGNLGVALLRSGSPKHAVNAFEKRLIAEPENAAALNALGVAQYESKQFGSAAATFKRVVELDPDHDESRYNLGVAQMANGNKAAVLSQYNLIRDTKPKLARKLYKLLYRDKILFVDK